MYFIIYRQRSTIGAGALLSFLDSVPGMGDALAGSGAGAGVACSTLMLLLNAGTLFGAIMMWKMKKLGFWIYSASFLAQFVPPMIMIGAGFKIFGLIIMAAFIVLYGINMKKMD